MHFLQLAVLDLHLSSAKFLSMHKLSGDWPDENPDGWLKLDDDDGDEREKVEELQVV